MRMDDTKASSQVKNAGVDLPIALPVSPMLAKAVAGVPAADSVAGGLAYEPKWDGFRVVAWSGGGARPSRLDSRNAKPLLRYFPELEPALAQLPPVKAGGVRRGLGQHDHL